MRSSNVLFLFALGFSSLTSASGAPENSSPVKQNQSNHPNSIVLPGSNSTPIPSVITSQLMTRKSFHPAGTSKTVILPQDKFFPDEASPFIMGKESIQLGGMYDPYGNSIHRSLSITGEPYSNYNAGCTLCIFSTGSGSGEGGAQAAISERDYHGSAESVSGSDFSSVGFYHYDENWAARVTVRITSFDANSATLKQPLTEAEQARLHQGMYISTNVISFDNKQNYGDGFKLLRSFHGFLRSWDATHIYVYHWAIPGGNSADGQIPDARYLDKVLSTYKEPVAFIGTPDGHVAENEYMVADGSRVIGNTATTTANSFEREEFDWRGYNWSLPRSVLLHGWTTSFECHACINNALDEDSYAYSVNGSGLPAAYRAQLDGDALEFRGNNAWLGGNGSPEIIAPDGSARTDAASVPVNTNHIMAGFDSHLPSNNTLNFVMLVNKEQKTNGTPADYGVRLGLNIDGTRDRKKGFTGGSWMGALGFNYAGHPGGVCILGSNTNPGLCVESSGGTDFYHDVTFAADRSARFKGAVIAEQGLTNPSGTTINAAASYDPAGNIFNGQGNAEFWNRLSPGKARTEYVNIDPTGGSGGFAWYNVQGSHPVSRPMFLLQDSRGAVFNVRASFAAGGSLLGGSTLEFQPGTTSGSASPGLKACDSSTLCVQGYKPEDIGFLAGTLQGGQQGTQAIWRPDGHGNWHAESRKTGGGAVSETSYRLSDLPSMHETDGAHVWCSDCVLNGISGVEAFWHASASIWTDSTNHPLAR